jgi:hypothetical protein
LVTTGADALELDYNKGMTGEDRRPLGQQPREGLHRPQSSLDPRSVVALRAAVLIEAKSHAFTALFGDTHPPKRSRFGILRKWLNLKPPFRDPVSHTFSAVIG